LQGISNFEKMILTAALPLGVFGPTQIILVIVIVLLLFGGKKIPELMKGLGQGIKEFKDASKGEESKPEDKKEA
jgi:sec-independent protein translocase protein TatA